MWQNCHFFLERSINLATTRGWALKGNVVNAVTYVLDLKNEGEKTDGGKLIFCSEGSMSPLTAAYEWKLNSQRKNSKSVGYHLQFSLPKNEGTAEECMELAKEWVDKISGGKAKCVIAVHTNTKNIHAHIICDWYLNDGRQWDIYWKRDKKIFRYYADMVCKSHGFSVLENQWDIDDRGKTRSYYEYSDNSREVLKKVLDATIPRVKSYEDLKRYLEIIGFKFYDNRTMFDKNTFTFTVDIKLINKQDDGTFLVRIPYQKDYIRVKPFELKWVKEDKTAKISLPVDKKINLLSNNGIYINTVEVGELKSHFEEKVENKREGLRIRIPESKKVIRTRRLDKNILGEGYSLEEILQRIDNNEIDATDPKILDVFEHENDYHKVCASKQKLYETADVKYDASANTLFRSLKQEGYFRWKASQIEKRMDALNYNNLLQIDRENINVMEDRLNELKNALNEINVLLANCDKDIESIMQQKLENVVNISDIEMEKYIKERKIPLIIKKDTVNDMIKLYTERIEAANKKEKSIDYKNRVI